MKLVFGAQSKGSHVKTYYADSLKGAMASEYGDDNFMPPSRPLVIRKAKMARSSMAVVKENSDDEFIPLHDPQMQCKEFTLGVCVKPNHPAALFHPSNTTTTKKRNSVCFSSTIA